MGCILDPIGCVFNALPWWAPWAFWGSVALIVFGVAWRFIVIARAVGGRAAMAGAIGLVLTALGVLASIFRPQRRALKADPYKHPADDPMAPIKVKPPRGTSRYNPDTKSWE